MTAPRIYVACLASYNDGILHGAWIRADQPVDGIIADAQAMLDSSPVPFAEEWAIHDYEGFGALRLSEWESFIRVSNTALGIIEYGGAFSAWLSYDTSQDPSDTSAFLDAYLLAPEKPDLSQGRRSGRARRTGPGRFGTYPRIKRVRAYPGVTNTAIFTRL
jgi:antirestriction protein